MGFLANLPINPLFVLIGAGVLALLFIVLGLTGRKSLDGASGTRGFDDRLQQFAGRAQRNQAPEVKPLERIDAAVSKGRQGSKIARDLARADGVANEGPRLARVGRRVSPDGDGHLAFEKGHLGDVKLAAALARVVVEDLGRELRPQLLDHV